MARIAKSERLLNLVAFLLKRRRPADLAEIKRSVDGYAGRGTAAASVDRRFERDKATLRELGVPLEYVSDEATGDPGYLIPHEAYFLPRVVLSPAEAAILAAAGQLAMAGTAGPVSDALASALRKLQFDSPIPGEVRQTAEEHFLFQTAVVRQSAEEEQNLKSLTAAVLARNAVRFTYYAFSDNRLDAREVEPYGLGYAGGHWYLVGRDRRRDAIRTFRSDRIRSEIRRVHPSGTRPEFHVPPDFRVRDHVGVPPWLFKRARKTPVRIRFDGDVAFMVRLRPAPGDRWEKTPRGGLILTRHVTNTDAFLNWVLGFGRHAEVLAPEAFRRQVIEKIEQVQALHQGRPRKGVARG